MLKTPNFKSLTGKESACNAVDAGSIPGVGRSPGEGTSYPLQGDPWRRDQLPMPVFWASLSSLVAQTVNNSPVMWETWVPFLGWEDSLGEGMATHSSILAWRIPMDRGAW